MTEYIRLKTPPQVDKADLYPPMVLPPDNTYVLVQCRGSYDLRPAIFKGLTRGIPQFMSPHSQVVYDILGWMLMPVVKTGVPMSEQDQNDVAR